MNNLESPLRPLESLLHDTKPAPLLPGPHREHLARQLRAHAAHMEDVPGWPMRYYAMALALSLLCLIVALLFPPKIVDVHSFQEQRQILASLLPDAGTVTVKGHQSVTLPSPRPVSPAPQISQPELLEQIQERRLDLIQVMDETSCQTESMPPGSVP